MQARLGSTRLPGKVLADIHGEPMLARVVKRARWANSLDEVVVATTSLREDDPLARLCEQRNYPLFRGHPTDVLDRYYRAGKAFAATVIVRLTGDCPLLDPDVLDQTVTAFLKAEPPADLAVNRFPGDRTFPIGLDVEVCSFRALEQAWREAEQPHQREHVMPYLYEEPGRFRVLHIKAEQDFGDLRWTVDTPEDLEFVRRVYAYFAPRERFSWKEVMALVNAQPELAAINAHVPAKGLRESEAGLGG